MKQKVFAYIRVSSKDQNISRQFEELKTLVADERDIYVDTISGKDFNRPKYQALKAVLRDGDSLYIKSLDRLGRNYNEIIAEWGYITKEINADIKVLDMPMLDTTQYKELIGTFISDLILQVLSFVAEQERINIRQRQAEGTAIAKTNGVKFGRPKAEYPTNWETVYSEWETNAITAVKAMQILGLKKNTFYKLVKEYSSVSVKQN